LELDIHLHAGGAEDADGGLLFDLDFELAIFELAGLELIAEFFAGSAALLFGLVVIVFADAVAGKEEIEQALFDLLSGGFLDGESHFRSDHGDGGVEQVADHGVDIAAVVADLGEFGGFDFHEGSAGEGSEPAGDLGFTDAGGADHDDVFRRDILAKRIGKLLATPAVADGDGDGAFGVGLADDVFVEFGDDLGGGEDLHG
jgi:hypothetical protein